MFSSWMLKSLLISSSESCIASISSIVPTANNKFPRFVSSSFSLLYPTSKAKQPVDFLGDYCNTPDEAVKTFKTMLSIGFGAISTYNYVLSTLAKMGSFNPIFSLVKQLEQELSKFDDDPIRTNPNTHTFTILIQCHSLRGNMSSALSLFNKIIDRSLSYWSNFESSLRRFLS
jgi:pentatricopeptide repeat protein